METTIPVIKDMHFTETNWVQGMHFVSEVQGHSIHMDKLAVHGGEDTGPRPKPLLLVAASGCTGMELIGILNKMRIKVSSLDISVNGELGDEQPKIYKIIHLTYKIGCDPEEKERVEKAIRLVEDKYCGIVAMIRHFAKYSSEIQFV